MFVFNFLDNFLINQYIKTMPLFMNLSSLDIIHWLSSIVHEGFVYLYNPYTKVFFFRSSIPCTKIVIMVEDIFTYSCDMCCVYCLVRSCIAHLDTKYILSDIIYIQTFPFNM